MGERMKCVNHPDREATFYCFKFRRSLCLECLTCQDPPPGRCRDRTACLIWEFDRRGMPEELMAEADAESRTGQRSGDD